MRGQCLLGCRHDSIRRVLPIHLAGVSEFVVADRDAPETLLCASVADCFILKFRSVARAAHFQ